MNTFALKLIKKTTSALAVSMATLLFCGVSNASLDNQFSQCAAEALKSQSTEAKVINVKLPSAYVDEMNHANSSKVREFKMKISSELENVSGLINCRISKSGVIESVEYVR